MVRVEGRRAGMSRWTGWREGRRGKGKIRGERSGRKRKGRDGLHDGRKEGGREGRVTTGEKE